MAKRIYLLAAAGLLLAFDIALGSIGFLYPSVGQEILLAVLVLAVIALIWFDKPALQYLLHNAALAGFFVRSALAGQGWGFDPIFVALVVVANLLVWLVVRTRRAAE